MGSDWTEQLDSGQEKNGTSIGIADLNGDGKLDLVLPRSERVEVYIQNNAGNLQNSTHLLSSVENHHGGHVVSIVDINDDGMNDFLVGREGAQNIFSISEDFDDQTEL